MHNPGAAEARKQRMLDVLAGRPEGVRRGELQELAGLQGLDAQVVRRLLLDLHRQGSLRIEGVTKRRRYFLGAGAALRPSLPPEEEEMPVSPEGSASRALMARPLAQRPLASHHPQFLEGYRPGETFYLPEALRRRLAGLGGPAAGQVQSGPGLRRQLLELAWNSARLEGFPGTFSDAEGLLERGEGTEAWSLQGAQTLLNHMAALEFLLDTAVAGTPEPRTVQNLHALLMENLLPSALDEGRLRVAPRRLQGSAYLPAAVPAVVEEGFLALLGCAGRIDDPFERSFFLLVHLLYLQPFQEGNEATARLVANIPLLGARLAPLTFAGVGAAAFHHGLLAVCELNRVDLLRDLFVFAYERSCTRARHDSSSPPDSFHWQHRADIKRLVRDVVLSGRSAPECLSRACAEGRLPKEALAHFRRAVERELDGLHEGNVARFQIRPTEFSSWQRQARLPEAGEG